MSPPRIKHGARDLRFIEEELPEVEIYIGSKLTVISETQIIVRCVASMDPAPAVSWKVQGKDSGFKDGVILSKDNSSLTITDPGVEDSGVYTCTASNNVGLDSESSIINILRKLSIFHHRDIDHIVIVKVFSFLSVGDSMMEIEP